MRGLGAPAVACRDRDLRPTRHANRARAPPTAGPRRAGRGLWQACIIVDPADHAVGAAAGAGGRGRAHHIGSHTQASRSRGTLNPSNSWTMAGSKLPKGLGAEAIEITICVGRGFIALSRGRA